MADCITQSFDFGIRIVQLAKWLKDEGKEFPLAGRLLECGTGLGISLRTAISLNNQECCVQALRQAEEVQFLLELMVKTDFITELQSEALLSDCKSIKKEIISEKLSSYRSREKTESNTRHSAEKQKQKKGKKNDEQA